MIVGRKPPNRAALELLWNHTNRTTVTCAGNFPERYIRRIVATNSLRLLERDVVIRQSMDQENGHAASNDRTFRGGVTQGDTMCDPSIQERKLDRRTQDKFAEPRSGANKLPHAHVGDLPQAGERRFSDHSTEAGFFPVRLEAGWQPP